jgi:hypothetical protein
MVGGMHRPFLARLLCLACAQRAGAADFDVRPHEAKFDGATLDTRAINRAIDAASATGGGTVLEKYTKIVV